VPKGTTWPTAPGAFLGVEHGYEAATVHPEGLKRCLRWLGLEDFSESKIVKPYAEAFPLERKAARGQRLRERQLALLRRLERLAAQTPQPSDLVAGWFDEALAAKLVTAGILTLGALNARIAAAGTGLRRCRPWASPRPGASSAT
jgi:hypothetical protein